MPLFPKQLGKMAFLLFCVLTFFCMFPVRPVEAENQRNEKVADDKAGPPCISGDWIVFSQKSGASYLPMYYSIANNNKALLNPAVSLNNNELVKIDRGVALYRSKDNRKLWISNLEEDEHWDLAKGASRAVADTDKLISSYFAISGNKIAYLEGDGSQKNCWMLKENGEALKIAAAIRAMDLRLYQDENYAMLSWRNKDDGILYYCDLNGDLSIHSLPGSKADSQYTLWQDKVLYRHPVNHEFYLQSLAPDAIPQEISLPGATGPVCLRDKDLFYAAGKSIKRYDCKNSSNEEIIKHENPICNLDSNGSDLVWQDSLSDVYWRAAVKTLSMSGQSHIKVGDSIQLSARAGFKNNYQQDVTQNSVWTSSDNSIATVASGFCTGQAAGSVTIQAVYERAYAQATFNVKALTSLEVSPTTANLKPGDTLQINAVGVYSDASREAMTSIVNWECTASGSISAQGLFTAGKAGVVQVKASYGLLSSTAQLTIAAANPGEPQPGEEDDEAVDPPGDQPQTPIRRSSDDDSAYINSPTLLPNISPILRALENAPQFSMVEVAVGNDSSDALEFTMEKAVFAAMNKGRKSLRIKSALGVLEFSPAFAASYLGEDISFRLDRAASFQVPAQYGNCIVKSASTVYTLVVKNEKAQLINDFAVPIKLTLFNNTEAKLNPELIQVLGMKSLNIEWQHIRSKPSMETARIFDCNFPGSFSIMELDYSFKDLGDHWARRDIKILAAQQLIEDSGASGIFAPERNISREEFACWLARALDSDLAVISTATGSEEGGKNSPYLAAAIQEEIIKGDLEGNLALRRAISREELAVMVWHALVRKNAEIAVYKEAKAVLGDRDKISAWAVTGVDNLQRIGIMQGRPDRSFAPRQASTRAEAAVVIRRVMDYLE